jgi:glycosyltransferase involved in cell wall biosynthesis
MGSLAARPAVEQTRADGINGRDAAATHWMPFVSVVIPTHGRPELLRACLRALLKEEYPSECLEVVVVEDGGPLGAASVLDELRTEGIPFDLRSTSIPHAGPAAARNAGWRLARGEIVAFTDDDTRPDPRWIAEGVRSVALGADAVSGRTIVPLGTRPTDAERNTQGLERAAFATCNAFCRRDLLEKVGGFDERFTRAYREDSDLEFTLRAAGARIVRNEDAVVVHPPRPERPFASLRQQRNQMFDALLYRKHPRDFRVHMRKRPPWHYYTIATSQLGTLVAIALGRRRIATLVASIWVPLVGRFCAERLRASSLRPAHVAEMIVTSALIPPVAVYWRLRGAWRFRVPFL